MASKSLTFEIFGKDKSASKTMKGVGDNASRMGDRFKKVGVGIGIGLAAAGAAAVAFGIDSAKAFVEAEKSQTQLSDAFKRFPALADTNLKELGKLNSELAKKTRFDDDATASGQAVLAQYGLTGKQLKKLTPLLQDYAAKTGKELPDAAGDLGKALMGQGRALKAIGLDFTDTGSLAGNFDSLVAGLRTQVGGFAAVEGETAAGKLAILQNRFGEIQETVGGPLIGALTGLADWFSDEGGMAALEAGADWIATDGVQAFKDAWTWVDKYSTILGPAAVAIGTLTAAQWLLNIAMDANPVGLVILALGALIAVGAALTTNFGGTTATLFGFMNGLLSVALGIISGVASVVQGVVNAVVGGVNGLIDLINPIRAAIGLGPIGKIGNVNLTSGLNAAAAMAGSTSGQQTYNNAVAYYGGGTSGPAANPVRQSKGGPKFFASGGLVRATPGGTNAVIGEAGTDEAVIPLTDQILSKIGGGGDTYMFTFPGSVIGSENQVAQQIVRTLENARRRGSIPAGALG